MALIILHAVRNDVIGFVRILGIDWFASDQSFLFSEFLVRNTGSSASCASMEDAFEVKPGIHTCVSGRSGLP
jgi:hypothetical protein